MNSNDGEAREPELAVRLMAIKWIGNAGSHESELTRDDFLDAYQPIDEVIAELYEKRPKKWSELSAKINHRGEPLSVARRREPPPF